MDILLFGTLPGFLTGLVAGWIATMVWLLWNIDSPRNHLRREEEDKP